ncbi:unnamed protein product [Rotaria sp. Silwood1]|nr:unnamed protein product [Rotaria sp. Silwood1]
MELIKTQEQLEASINEKTLDFEEMKRRLIKAVREKADLFNSIYSYEIKLEEEQSKQWVHEDDVLKCTKCETLFGWTLRKYRCRHCHKIFCYYCSNHWYQGSTPNDPYCFAKDLDYFMTDSPNEEPSQLALGDDIVYYSHPFEFELWYMPPSVAADHELPRMPKIYFQVASQDGWGRHRTEGYTYLDIPSFPGFYDEDLSCWRPRGASIFNELRRFFIGGSNELEDISYVAMPKQVQSEKNKTPLSRFGFRTVTTGTLNIRLNVIFQSQEIALEYGKKRSAHERHHYGFNAFMSNIKATLGKHTFHDFL